MIVVYNALDFRLSYFIHLAELRLNIPHAWTKSGDPFEPL